MIGEFLKLGGKYLTIVKDLWNLYTQNLVTYVHIQLFTIFVPVVTDGSLHFLCVKHKNSMNFLYLMISYKIYYCSRQPSFLSVLSMYNYFADII